MQQCCHLSTYIVPFHTRKVNRNFTKKRGQRAKDSAGFLAILTKSIRGKQGASFRAYRTYVRIVVYIRNIRSEQMFAFNSEHMFFMPEHTFLFQADRFPNKCSVLYQTNILYMQEHTFVTCENVSSSPARTNVLLRTYVHIQKNVCSPPGKRKAPPEGGAISFNLM